jgi:hypothetical protein
MSHSIRRLLILAASAALLAGCSSEKIDYCPGVSSLIQTSIATIFRPDTTADPSNVLYTVEIMSVQPTCDADKTGDTANTSLDVKFRATRTPNGAPAHYKVPYFVAVTREAHIVAKKVFTVEFDFAPGQSTVLFHDAIGSAAVTAGRDKKSFDYNVLVGLQLTRDQLDYNRASGHYAP